MERGPAVVSMVLLQDVADMRWFADGEQRVSSRHGEAYDISERLCLREYREGIAGECREHTEDRNWPAKDRRRCKKLLLPHEGLPLDEGERAILLRDERW